MDYFDYKIINAGYLFYSIYVRLFPVAGIWLLQRWILGLQDGYTHYFQFVRDKETDRAAESGKRINVTGKSVGKLKQNNFVAPL